MRHLAYSAPPMPAASRTNPMLTHSIQERCGINTRFPGKTEYMTRYRRPNVHDFVRGYMINPLPNYAATGRPMARHEYVHKQSEYEARYIRPDGSTLTKFPWLRK